MIVPDVTDRHIRQPISDSVKEAIRDSFLVVPEGKSSALVAIYDSEQKQARLHFAWKTNNMWKVGAQVGWSLHEKPNAIVAVEAAW